MDSITWKAFEHNYTEKTTDWYWIVGIVTISITIISVLMNNIIFAVLVLVASFTMSLFASRRPAVVNVTVSSTGIAFGQTFYPYSTLKSFWIETRDNNPRMILETKRVFMPFTTIPIDDDIKTEDVEKYLRKYIKIEEHIEPFFEKLLVYLGF